LGGRTFVSSYYYAFEFARPAQMICNGKRTNFPLRRKGAKFIGEKAKSMRDNDHPYFPNFACFASLREIFRDLVAALPRWVLRGDKFCQTACLDVSKNSRGRQQLRKLVIVVELNTMAARLEWKPVPA
jgi:hypothetical protein